MNQQYDLIVIGAGSGGIATAIRAAKLGARCVVVEANQLGGTCVNEGCVPKKLTWLVSNMATAFHQAQGLGFEPVQAKLDWSRFVQKRQEYIQRLHDIYAQKLKTHQVDLILGVGQFIGPHQVQVDQTVLEAPHIVIATGGRPQIPPIEGAKLGIDSDGFFALKQLPKRVMVVGGGYIGLELAGMLAALGSQTYLAFRQPKVLRTFDPMISKSIMEIYQQQLTLLPEHIPLALRAVENHFILDFQDKPSSPPVDLVIWAVGRALNTAALNLAALPLLTNAHGAIDVDRWQNTSQPGIYAIGDVTGQKALTPVAIAAGRRLATRLFGHDPQSHLDYHLIPSVVFSHPPIGTVGLTEPQAREKYLDDVIIFQTRFTPMSQALLPHPYPMSMKLIVQKSSDKILGCHIVGEGADEMLQGFAVAIKMGATKQDFDNTVGIHPTAAEELVTLT